jgi:ribose-phosphate pyrophosphokinase
MYSLNSNDLRIFSGQSHPELAAGIAAYLGIPLDPTRVGRYCNDNLYVQLGASVRGRIVFIVQSLIQPVSERIMELLMMLDIARGAGAEEVHAIIPYYSYARSDKKDAPRISITARLIADLLVTAGATHIMTMTLHSPQVHGFFSVPTDPLTARFVFAHYINDCELNTKDTVVISPDIGRAKPASRFARLLGISMAAAQKERITDNEVRIGDTLERQIKGYRRALVYDDEIATGTTVLELSKLLVNYGVEEIVVICTHGLFTGNSLQQLNDFPQVTRIITTDTVPIPPEKRNPQLEIISVAPVFGEAIRRNLLRQPIGDLFSYSEDHDG